MAPAAFFGPLGRYAYLVVFFALLAGVFHPFVADSDMATVIIGTMALFSGLAGCILVYRGVTAERVPDEFSAEPDHDNLQHATEQQTEIVEPAELQTLAGDRPAKPRRPGSRTVPIVGGFILVSVSLAYVYFIVGTA